jgi:hypothetical protein
VRIPNVVLDLCASHDALRRLGHLPLERAIGVIYRPETGRQSHHSHARLPDRYDAILYCGTTRAVEHLERPRRWAQDEAPEIYRRHSEGARRRQVIFATATSRGETLTP